MVAITSKPRGVNTLRPRQNVRHFADDILKCIFLNENVWIPIEISLKFVPQGPINNIPALVQIMAWRRPGDKPLSGPMMVRLPTHICVTRPQWVNTWSHQSFQPWWSTFWKSIFKQQLGCRFDKVESFIFFTYVIIYVLIYHIIFWLYRYFLNIFYFSKYSCTNIFHRRSLCTFHDVIKWNNFPRNWPFLRGILPSQRPVTRTFDVFFDLRLNKRLSKQSWGWRYETPLRPLWRHCI